MSMPQPPATIIKPPHSLDEIWAHSERRPISIHGPFSYYPLRKLFFPFVVMRWPIITVFDARAHSAHSHTAIIAHHSRAGGLPLAGALDRSIESKPFFFDWIE